MDYEFISVPDFAAMRDRGEFLEWAEVYGNYYATPRRPIEAALAQGKTVLAELDIQGAQAVKRTKPDALLIFIEPPSLDDLLLRLRGRGTEDPESLSRRVNAAYDEVKARRIYDHIVINDTVERAAAELLRIIEQEEKARR